MPTKLPISPVVPSRIYKQPSSPSSHSQRNLSTMPSDEFYLHHLLRYYQQQVIQGHVCPLQWDVREAPETSRRVVKPDHSISPFFLSRPATEPPMIILHITCDIFPEAWPIEISKLDTVTVGDVLHAIHSTLMRPVRRDEWERLSEKQRSRIKTSFEARCEKAPNRDECRSVGVIRVDCLLQHTLFGGLTASLEADCSCILTLRRPH